MTDYKCPLPPKLPQSRTVPGANVGHAHAPITRAGMHAQSTAPASKNVNLEPSIPTREDYENQQSGMMPAGEPPADDAQSAATTQPEVETETEAKEPVETTATPTGGGESESLPAEENEPTGGVAAASYPAQIDAAHPRGYPGQ